MKKTVVIHYCMVAVVLFFAATAFAQPEELLKNVEISGLIEVEASTEESFDNENSSDITLSTVEVAVLARINEWVEGGALFLYEEDETELSVDEGFITIRNEERTPFHLKAGKMVVPFGIYQSRMISDPLTLEIGETHETAILAGIASRGFDINLYACKGDTMESVADDRVTHYGAFAAYAKEFEKLSVDVGAGYLSSLMDSDGLSGFLTEQEETIPETSGLLLERAPFVGGFAAHAIFCAGPVAVITEYVGAVEEYELDYTDAGGFPETISFQPKAYTLEADYSFNVFEKEAFAGIGYQRTDEMAGTLPEIRYLACTGAEIFRNTSVALEYAHDDDYDAEDGGTDEVADRVTAKLAVIF